MIYADKENLKTQVSKDLLVIREREMDFYARNLSMVGTHAALLAGFAFSILTGHEFKTPDEGFLSFETEKSLGMWLPNASRPFGDERTGMGSWTWNTAVQQILQLAHLIFTTLGIMLHLWTVYTTVVTNILGLHLALRGPEGSVDRAVRHMAQQNQFALRKFMLGLILFILSVLFYAISEFHVFISIWICMAILGMCWLIYQHIRELVGRFFLPQESMVTGQWFDADTRSQAAMGAAARAAAAAALDAVRTQRRVSIDAMSNMVAFTPDTPNGKRPSDDRKETPRSLAPASAKSGSGELVSALRTRMKGQSAKADATKVRNGWNAGNTVIEDRVSTVTEEQVPSTIAEKLIYRQQNPEEALGKETTTKKRSFARSLTRTGTRFISVSTPEPSASVAAANAAFAANYGPGSPAADSSAGERKKDTNDAAQQKKDEDKAQKLVHHSGSILGVRDTALSNGPSADFGQVFGDVLTKLGISQSSVESGEGGSKDEDSDGAEDHYQETPQRPGLQRQMTMADRWNRRSSL